MAAFSGPRRLRSSVHTLFFSGFATRSTLMDTYVRIDISRFATTHHFVCDFFLSYVIVKLS